MLFTVGGGGCGPGECLHLEKLERHDFSKDDDISKTSSTLRVKISHLLWNKRKKRVKFNSILKRFAQLIIFSMDKKNITARK